MLMLLPLLLFFRMSSFLFPPPRLLPVFLLFLLSPLGSKIPAEPAMAAAAGMTRNPFTASAALTATAAAAAAAAAADCLLMA
jgi:hypothetical protein